MKTSIYKYLGLLLLLASCIILGGAVYAQQFERVEDIDAIMKDVPNTVADVFPGTGILMAGDLWESIMPLNKGPYYGEASDVAAKGVRQFIRFGNFDRSWSTPGGHWPGAWFYTVYWGKYMHVMEFNPDSTWNPKQIGGKDNPSFYANSAEPENTGTYSNYAYAAYFSTLDGANDPARNYTKETYWLDANKRTHQVYECGFPTTLGLDVKIRAHAFSGPNWNNLNDFVIFEISFKNTGKWDPMGTGTPYRTNNKIRALAINMAAEVYMSIGSYFCGRRCNSELGARRNAGYVGDADPDGNPWEFVAFYPGNSTAGDPPGGQHDLGMNVFPRKWYQDIWTGWTWLGVKKGGLPSNPAASTGPQADKQTIFGTHGIGVGPERGWYTTAGTGKGLPVVSFRNPKAMHWATIGCWYKDGGKVNDASKKDLSPNPNFFDVNAPGTKAGDVTTFVPKTAGRTRPNGDRKLLSEELSPPTAAFVDKMYEDGHADANTMYPTGWGRWTKGFVNTTNFDGELFSGVGPFSLDVGEEMTIVLATVSGFRLEGIQKSVRAARWAYENNFNIPEPPPAPEMKVSATFSKSILLEWDKRAESDPAFAGYKIWKSSGYKKFNWTDYGIRMVDRYQEQMTPGPPDTTLRKPMNPYFDAWGAVAASSTKGQYQPDTWGTWELVKVIPKSDLGTTPKAVSTGYNYSYEDKDVVLGFSYWYYISAYKEGTFTGPGGETTSRIESHYLNRNGASGLWVGTFPFSQGNPFWPTTASGLKDIGAVQVAKSPVVPTGTLNAGLTTPGVRPNPYKRAAMHDNIANVYDHKLLFYNLPSPAKITILDVSGQVIDQIDFSSPTDPNNGIYFWDMFSKDGIEVASGLYIYVVQWAGGTYTGKFAILR